MTTGLSGRNTSDYSKDMVYFPTRTNDDSFIDSYDGNQPSMRARDLISKILCNVWNVTDLREFQIRVISFGASHK